MSLERKQLLPYTTYVFVAEGPEKKRGLLVISELPEPTGRS